MHKWLTLFLWLLVFSLTTQAQKVYHVGDTLPVFTSVTNEGKPFAFDTLLPRVTVVVFWASWNAPSLQILDELKQQYPFVNPTRRGVFNHNVDVIDFSIDQRKENYNITVKREGWPWDTHLNEWSGWESDVINTLQLRNIPVVFLVDVHRKILQINPEVNQIRSMLAPYRTLQSLSN